MHCPFNAPALQVHGHTCGPLNTGPLEGWFVIVICATVPSASRARRRFGPLTNPVTRPMNLPSALNAKAFVMLVPFRSIFEIDPYAPTLETI